MFVVVQEAGVMKEAEWLELISDVEVTDTRVIVDGDNTYLEATVKGRRRRWKLE